jgi:hypothetical protein
LVRTALRLGGQLEAAAQNLGTGMFVIVAPGLFE